MNYFPYQYGSGTQIVKVNGENGAMAYQMAPNSSVLLLDETQPIVWLKQTDGAGYPTVTPYKIEPYVKPKEPDLNEIISRLNRLEEMINESHTSEIRTNKTEWNHGHNEFDEG